MVIFSHCRSEGENPTLIHCAQDHFPSNSAPEWAWKDKLHIVEWVGEARMVLYRCETNVATSADTYALTVDPVLMFCVCACACWSEVDVVGLPPSIFPLYKEAGSFTWTEVTSWESLASQLTLGSYVFAGTYVGSEDLNSYLMLIWELSYTWSHLSRTNGLSLKWRNDSLVKNACWFCQGPRFGSQYPQQTS